MKKHLLLLAAILAPAAVIFLEPGLDLLVRNAEYFKGDVFSLAPLFLLTVFYALLGALFFYNRSRARAYRVAFYTYLLSAPAWIILKATAGAEGHSLLQFATILLAGFAGAILLEKRKFSALQPCLSGFALYGCLVLALSGNSFFTILQQHASHRSAVAIESSSTERNTHLPDIYHLMLDEFQNEMMTAALNDETRNALHGFTWYNEASTPFGRTEMALSSMFSGQEYKPAMKPADYITHAFLSPDSMIAVLQQAGYETYGYLHTTFPHDAKSPFMHTLFHRDLAGDLSTKTRRHLLLSLWIFSHFPLEISKLALSDYEIEQLQSQTLLPSDAPYISYESFETFLKQEEAVSTPGGRYIFIHLILPHFPTVMGAHCEYKKDKTTSAQEQASCALTVIQQLVTLLKKQGRFNQAIILAHGDHGAKYLLRDGKLIKTDDAYYGPHYSLARSRPVLLFKPSGETDKHALATDSRATDLLDIYPTLVDNLALKNAPHLSGSSLLKKPHLRQRYYHFYDKNRKDPAKIMDGFLMRYKVSKGKVMPEQKIPMSNL